MAMEHIRDVLERIPGILTGMYESPAEECLGERLRSAIDPTAKFQTQIWVDTWAGRFRLDILLTDKNGRRVAVEVDGKDFHEPIRDHWRTVFIVGDKQADVVYRVPASDLKVNLIGVLAGLAALEPMCFSQADISRWREIVDRGTAYLADDEDEGDEEDNEYADGERSFRDRWMGYNMAIESHFLGDARDCERATIKTYYDFAVATGLKDLDAIQLAWKHAQPSRPIVGGPSDPFDFSKLFE